MNYTDIEKALLTSYQSFDSLTPTEFPNAPLTENQKDSAELWAKVTNVPGDSEPVTLGDQGQDNHPGFLQVDYNIPKNRGDGAALEKIDALATAFPAGRALTYNSQVVTVQRTSRSPGRYVGGYYRVSLTIYYYARTSRS